MNSINSQPVILAISCFYHDSAACLMRAGKIVAAAQEERFTRKKHDPRFPRHAIAYWRKRVSGFMMLIISLIMISRC